MAAQWKKTAFKELSTASVRVSDYLLRTSVALLLADRYAKYNNIGLRLVDPPLVCEQNVIMDCLLLCFTRSKRIATRDISLNLLVSTILVHLLNHSWFPAKYFGVFRNHFWQKKLHAGSCSGVREWKVMSSLNLAWTKSNGGSNLQWGKIHFRVVKSTRSPHTPQGWCPLLGHLLPWISSECGIILEKILKK